MPQESKPLVFAESDLLGYTIDELVCTNCIEGFCPARTAAVCGLREFTFCGARKIADDVVAAYNERTASNLVIEKPC